MPEKSQKHPPSPRLQGAGKNKETKKQDKDNTVEVLPRGRPLAGEVTKDREKTKIVVAKGRYLRSSTQKVGLVLKLIRGKSVEEAEKILRFTNKKAAVLTLKILKSALANAQHNLGWKAENLIIKKAVANPGPSHKRIRFGAHGRIKPILKRTCHITIGLEKQS